MDLIGRILPKLHAKREQRGDEELSHQEKVVIDVMALQADVMNGGFDQFFFNSAGDRAVHTMTALREIGAGATAAILEEACARFPRGSPDTDRFARQKQLEAMASDTFSDLDQRFFTDPEDAVDLLSAFWSSSGGSET